MTARIVEMKRDIGQKKDLLDVIDALRADVESGKVLAFSCVGFDAEDTCRTYQATSIGTTNLRMQGALVNLLYHHVSGKI